MEKLEYNPSNTQRFNPHPLALLPSKKYAFTLAEVLITLGVIGIVAAMTLPALITKYQKKQTVNQLKKVYTELQQAAEMYQAHNEITLTEFDTSLGDKEFMKRYISPYLSVIKECDDFKSCYGNKTPLAIDGKTQITVGYMIVLSDGTFLGINGRTESIAGATVFYADLNGAKKPNRSGRDIFYFTLMNPDTMDMELNPACKGVMAQVKAGFYPGGYASCYRPFTTYSREELLGTSVHRACNHNASTISSLAGDACAAVIMHDGWEIKDDYPW